MPAFSRVYLKTHDVTGSEGFLRCARHFFAGILTYFKENDAAHRKKARCPGALGVFRYTLGQRGKYHRCRIRKKADKAEQAKLLYQRSFHFVPPVQKTQC